jgi:site-specific recombinase XerC
LSSGWSDPEGPGYDAGSGHVQEGGWHTFATEMIKSGMRIEVLQQLLGHQSIELTMRYARLSDETQEKDYF